MKSLQSTSSFQGDKEQRQGCERYDKPWDLQRHRETLKFTATAISLIICDIAVAQAPDVKIKGDFSLGMTSSKDFSLGAKSYTPLGRYSIFSLQTLLPIGLNVFLSERSNAITNDPDNDSFDEYYVEDPGLWRVGKQYIPFGGGGFFRQSVLAARVDSKLLLGGLPAALAFVDGGRGHQYGLAGRIGNRGLGFSFALGRHWGINSTSLALTQSLQTPEGTGKGWEQAYEVDVNRRNGKFTYRAEALFLREPEGTSKEKELGDFQAIYDFGHKHSATVGVSKELGTSDLLYRFGGVYNAAKGIQLEGLYRLDNTNFRDFSVFLRIRF
jgi:hypothetical protein